MESMELHSASTTRESEGHELLALLRGGGCVMLVLPGGLWEHVQPAQLMQHRHVPAGHRCIAWPAQCVASAVSRKDCPSLSHVSAL